ncbi:MAG: hypothetical protein KAT14_03585 [Candidatus Marinimicrobia bacterium]|nr:hypothetical protein [Candidatus Neomarinimicrobiota bacterium]
MPDNNNICHYENKKLIRCSKNTVKVIRDTFCKHCGADLRVPKEIIPGVFGRFYDIDGACGYNYLKRIEEGQDPYIDLNGDYWQNFQPGLPDEFIVVPESDEL